MTQGVDDDLLDGKTSVDTEWGRQNMRLTGIRNAIIIQDDSENGGWVTFKGRCDDCGYVDWQERSETYMGTGMEAHGYFRCGNCGTDKDVYFLGS